MKKLPVEEKKSKNFTFYVGPEDYEIISKRAATYGSIASYLREMALKGEVIPRFLPEEEKLFDKLVAACREFNGMAESAEIKYLLHYLQTVIGPLMDELLVERRKADKERARMRKRAAALRAGKPGSSRPDNG